MTHPTEKLAEYVDGTLPLGEQARVSSHVETCDMCREEVHLARRARGALATVPEIPVPGETPPRVEPVVGKPTVKPQGPRAPVATPRSAKPGTETAGAKPRSALVYKVAAFAAAAAFAGIFAVVLLRSDEPEFRTVSDAASPSPPAAAAEQREQLNLTDDEFTSAELQPLATSVAERRSGKDASGTAGDAAAPELGEQEAPPAASPEPAPVPPIVAARIAPPTPRAQKCLDRSGAFQRGGQLTGVIDATFEGKPAFLGILLEGAGPGGTPDKVVVWVAAKGSCEVQALAQSPL